MPSSTDANTPFKAFSTKQPNEKGRIDRPELKYFTGKTDLSIRSAKGYTIVAIAKKSNPRNMVAVKISCLIFAWSSSFTNNATNLLKTRWIKQPTKHRAFQYRFVLIKIGIKGNILTQQILPGLQN
jgi:hypothetical protein